MYLFLIALISNLAFSKYTADNSVVLLPNTKEILDVCNKKHNRPIDNKTAIAIRTTNTGLSNIKDSFTLIALLDNGQFTENFHATYATAASLTEIFKINSSIKSKYQIGLGMDHYGDGNCHEVIIPNDKTFFESILISNRPDIKVNTIISKLDQSEFLKIHSEACSRKYCTEGFDDCPLSCMKPSKLIATSDLDNDKISEYWFESFYRVKKLNFVLEIYQEKDTKKWRYSMLGAQVFPND